MSDSGPGRREVAYRLFAAEFDDAEFSYSESDEERAPNYVVTPTGARANRVFAVGVLTEVEDVNPEMVRGRVVDPTGALVTYAGQYQPEALAFLERADPPAFVALSGKARTFEPDDGDRIYTSVRPESVSEVDAETRDRAAVVAAERTLERIGVMASAIESGLTGDRLREALTDADVDERLADGVALAQEYYGTTPAYLEALRELALDVARVVAGEIEEVGSLDVAPGDGGGDAAPLATLELSAPAEAAGPTTSAGGPDAGTEPAEPDATGASTASPTTADPDVETGADAETGSAAATGAEPDETTEEPASEPDTGAVSGTDPAPAGAGETDVEEPSATGTEESAAAAAEQTTDDAEEAVAEDEPGDFDPGEFELDDEERREVEEEYGTEFSTADEVESADVESTEPDVEPESETEPEADTEPASESESGPGAEAEPGSDAEPEPGPASEPEPEPEPEAEPEADVEPEPEPEPEAEAEPEPETEAASEADQAADEAAEEEPAAAVDLEDAVVETMESLDEGDGADREEVVASVVDEHGADREAVEAAVQDALMSGRCYEPSDGTLKSI